MGFNLLIYNEKISRLLFFIPSSHRSLLIQCRPALLMHASGEDWTAITIRMLKSEAGWLKQDGLSICLRGEDGGGSHYIKQKDRNRVGFSQQHIQEYFFDVQHLIYIMHVKVMQVMVPLIFKNYWKIGVLDIIIPYKTLSSFLFILKEQFNILIEIRSWISVSYTGFKLYRIWHHIFPYHKSHAHAYIYMRDIRVPAKTFFYYYCRQLILCSYPKESKQYKKNQVEGHR